ncbi:hypothetical protein ACFOY4_01290 [Actinomadura syzygii]|uniref:hypothetical protein n=1 Tax=Actinomadura syzygii TaxID=1427538 RepID=UPI001FE7793F|nr:hypothetical protein [Actinomadura syzygii]
MRLRPLTLLDEGPDEVLVGSPESGTYITVPTVGALVIRALERGASIPEAQVEATRYAGEPVDVAAFVGGLRELGFLAEHDDEDGRRHADAPARIRRTAPIQQRRWVTGLDTRKARPFFSRAAWLCYAGALVFSVGCFVLRPSLIPRPGDVFLFEDRGLAVLFLLPFGYLMSALHEGWHWLAARAAGVSARFGIDRRLYFMVFETDLSQLWTLPRRQRYGPQLAGLAIDSFVLGGLVGIRLLDETGWCDVPALVAGVAGALAFMTLSSMVWQCMVFLRTDLYGVLLTLTGCHDLWNTKTLLLRRAFGRLGPAHSEQLASARPRDVAVARWFRWVYLIGVPVALAHYAVFRVPIFAGVAIWACHGLAVGPLAARFWYTLAISSAVFLPSLVVMTTWLLDLYRRRLTMPLTQA